MSSAAPPSLDPQKLDFQHARTEAAEMMNGFLHKAVIDRLGNIRVGDFYAYRIESGKESYYKVYRNGTYHSTSENCTAENIVNRLARILVPGALWLEDHEASLTDFEDNPNAARLPALRY
jgi:hypothetical protein